VFIYQLDLPADIFLELAFIFKMLDQMDQCSIFKGVILENNPFEANTASKNTWKSTSRLEIYQGMLTLL
jgi:hypothetical protein